MSPDPAAAPLRIARAHALVLGLLHGPAELLPISSSGHVTIVPWLLHWEYAETDPELRKAFEVALHAGTALALTLALRDEIAQELRSMTARGALRLAVSALPAAVAGLALEGPIQRRLGTPETIAPGLVAGALAMAWADRSTRDRHLQDADVRDALWIGVAQACALIPGVSRGGATLAAARRRGLDRADAGRFSRQTALPVIGGATALKALRLARAGMPADARMTFALGAGSAFASTLACASLARRVQRDSPLASYSTYRLALAALVIARGRRERRTAAAPTTAAATVPAAGRSAA